MDDCRPVFRELCDVKTERTEKRLEKHDVMLDDLKECTVKLTQMLELHNEKLNGHEARLEDLEKKPSDFLEKIGTALITALIAALVSLILQI